MAFQAVQYGPSGPHVAFDLNPPARARPGGVTPPVAQQARPANPRDRTRELKQLVIDRFSYFQKGVNEFMNYDADGRRAIRQLIPIPPRAGPWPGHPPVRQAPGQTMWRIGKPGLLSKLLPKVGRQGQAKRAADRVGKLLKSDFRPARFKFRRRLGYGGFGAAFLFEMRDKRGWVIPIVVKADISGMRRDKGMESEKENFVVSQCVRTS